MAKFNLHSSHHFSLKSTNLLARSSASKREQNLIIAFKKNLLRIRSTNFFSKIILAILVIQLLRLSSGYIACHALWLVFSPLKNKFFNALINPRSFFLRIWLSRCVKNKIWVAMKLGCIYWGIMCSCGYEPVFWLRWYWFWLLTLLSAQYLGNVSFRIPFQVLEVVVLWRLFDFVSAFDARWPSFQGRWCYLAFVKDQADRTSNCDKRPTDLCGWQ